MNKSKESRLRRLEQQLADPRQDDLAKLARLLGVSVDDLPDPDSDLEGNAELIANLLNPDTKSHRGA